MDKHRGAGQIARHQHFEGAVQGAAHLALNLQLSVLRQVPIWKQTELSLQQRLIVGRQYARSGRQLPCNERIDGLHVKRVIGLRLVRVDSRHHGAIAQVCEQHEALRRVPCQNLRGFQTGLFHELGDFDKGFTIFFVGRRVHHDQAGTRNRVDTQITPETGIGRRNSQACRHQAMRGGQCRKPIFTSRLALRVCPGHI